MIPVSMDDFGLIIGFPQVDGNAWDMTRPLEGSCALQLFSFDDAEGKEVELAQHQQAAPKALICPCSRSADVLALLRSCPRRGTGA